jgi:hypothetical protein
MFLHIRSHTERCSAFVHDKREPVFFYRLPSIRHKLTPLKIQIFKIVNYYNPSFLHLSNVFIRQPQAVSKQAQPVSEVVGVGRGVRLFAGQQPQAVSKFSAPVSRAGVRLFACKKQPEV